MTGEAENAKIRKTVDQRNALEIDQACASLRNVALEEIGRGLRDGVVEVQLYVRAGVANGHDVHINRKIKISHEPQ